MAKKVSLPVGPIRLASDDYPIIFIDDLVKNNYSEKPSSTGLSGSTGMADAILKDQNNTISEQSFPFQDFTIEGTKFSSICLKLYYYYSYIEKDFKRIEDKIDNHIKDFDSKIDSMFEKKINKEKEILDSKYIDTKELRNEKNKLIWIIITIAAVLLGAIVTFYYFIVQTNLSKIEKTSTKVEALENKYFDLKSKIDKYTDSLKVSLDIEKNNK